MSTARCDDDTWDIASSVGATAVMVAAGRAAETRPLERAHQRSPRRNAGRRCGHRELEALVDNTVMDTVAPADAELAALIEHICTYQGVGTHVFDRSAFTRSADVRVCARDAPSGPPRPAL